MNTKEIVLDVVIDRHLNGLLRELELEEPLRNGELLCAQCGKVITMENLGAIELRGQEVLAYCDELIDAEEREEQ